MSNIQCIKSSIISPPFALPDGWTWYKWGDLVVGYEQGLIRSNLDLVDQGTFYFKMHNIAESGFCNYDKREFTKASDDEIRKYSVSNGDFLINVRNSYELVGKTCVVSNIPAKSTYNHMIIKVIHVDNRLNYYINALFSKTFWRKYIEACRKGTTTVIALYKDDLLNIPIPIPPEYVFNEIYELEKAFIEKRTKNLLICSKLESMAKTLYDYWFTQFDFPNEEGKPYRWSGGTMEWNEQLKRNIPKGWKVGQLSDIANITMGQSPSGETYNEDGIGTVFYQGCTDFGTRFPSPRVYTTAPTRFAKAGDILMSVRAPVGTLNVAIEDCSIGRGLAALNSKMGSQLYLWYTLFGFKQLFGVLDGNGTTFGSITKDTLYEMKVVIPNPTQVRAFEIIVQPIEQKIRVIEEENRELTKLRDWLLPMLMNGQATVE